MQLHSPGGVHNAMTAKQPHHGGPVHVLHIGVVVAQLTVHAPWVVPNKSVDLERETAGLKRKCLLDFGRFRKIEKYSNLFEILYDEHCSNCF
jgi:hypothetical protein